VSVAVVRGCTFVVTAVAAVVLAAKHSFVCAVWGAVTVVLRCCHHNRSSCSRPLIRWKVALEADRLLVVLAVVGVGLGVVVEAMQSVGSLHYAAVVVVPVHCCMTISSDTAVVPADMGRMVERRTAVVQRRASRTEDRNAGARLDSPRRGTVGEQHFLNSSSHQLSCQARLIGK
jgi:hypothetical protein